MMELRQEARLTFKANLRDTRYGWLRLTPAYSVHLVEDILRERPAERVLDPSCGTGTTALVCAERGIACDTTDINPFLLWLARTKTRVYSAAARRAFVAKAESVGRAIRRGADAPWVPPLHRIERWWAPRPLAALGRAMAEIRRSEGASGDLLRVAFCRTMIAHANVSFGHQSMSFRAREEAREDEIAATWARAVESIAASAASPIRATATPVHCDARDLRALEHRYDLVVTSPPYPNRMSYIRELRPYMYWLGYLKDGREAGELDWKAIGGTWGCATSNVAKWSSDARAPYRKLDAIVSAIAKRSDVLARYVAKYFFDMTAHAESLFDVVAPGGTVHYIVGNSKFYEVMLPVEAIFAALFEAAGFADARFVAIRKRSSKKELFEFVVSARRPGARRGSSRTNGRAPLRA